MRQHAYLWPTLVAGVCLVPVAIATENGWAAVIATIFVLASLIGFAYGYGGEADPRRSVLPRRRRQRAGRHR